MEIDAVTLLIFTCENREHLLLKTYQSFTANCSYKFQKTILAIDGQIHSSVIDEIKPDLIIQHCKRSGYPNSISKALNLIDTPYFFWLEDDWKFLTTLNLQPFISELHSNENWAEIVYSKTGPLADDEKNEPRGKELYKNVHGFSANPCICRTSFIKDGFDNLLNAPKGDRLGEDGFENFLTWYFDQRNLICVIHDPVDQAVISHEGYLESTPRNWHMTNSLESKTKHYLLTMPAPSLFRKFLMIGKLLKTFVVLAIKQLSDNKVYELCFRIMSSAMTIKKDE